MTTKLNVNNIEGHLLINPFILNSTSCELYILYLISIDISKNYNNLLVESSDLFVEIESLEIYIHDSAFTSLEYRAVAPGKGYRLPRIVYNKCNE